MTSIGTALTASATKVVLLGAGELGKEVAIELQRFGVEVVAVDRYANAPAMQIAHRSHVINMLDTEQLRNVLRLEKPDLIVPEIEAIATEILEEFETNETHVVPTPTAVQLTMNREGIRNLAAQKLELPTSAYRFADSSSEYESALQEIGYPCIVKPVMSSSGKGQSFVRTAADAGKAWDYAHSGTRGSASSVIVEQFIDFDYEITLLTIRHAAGTSFCEPIGHLQVDGDYRESWQPQPMSDTAKEKCQQIARRVTDELGGFGLFGAEFFVRGDEVWFSEISPRPHDTGLVTLASQNLSEFALHARAILGLPIPAIELLGPSASCVILAEGTSKNLVFDGLDTGMQTMGSEVRLFGKPEVDGRRRVGVAVVRGSENIDDAREKARQVVDAIDINDGVNKPSDSIRRA